MKSGAAIRALQLSILFCGLVSFELLSRAFPFFPSSAAVFRASWELLAKGDLYSHLLVTLVETFAGFLIAILLGVWIGIMLGASRTLGELFEPIILSGYAIPKIIFLPLLLMIFGVGLNSKAANAALHAILPVILNTLVGVREVSRTLLKVARSMRATKGQLFRKVYFPSIVPPVFAGMRIGLGFAFLGSLLAELFEAKAGLGFLVGQFYNSAEIAKMLAVITFVFVLTMAVNAGMKGVESSLSRWRNVWKS